VKSKLRLWQPRDNILLLHNLIAACADQILANSPFHGTKKARINFRCGRFSKLGIDIARFTLWEEGIEACITPSHMSEAVLEFGVISAQIERPQ
jgi:hypothetical protein